MCLFTVAQFLNVEYFPLEVRKEKGSGPGRICKVSYLLFALCCVRNVTSASTVVPNVIIVFVQSLETTVCVVPLTHSVFFLLIIVDYIVS